MISITLKSISCLASAKREAMMDNADITAALICAIGARANSGLPKGKPLTAIKPLIACINTSLACSDSPGHPIPWGLMEQIT